MIFKPSAQPAELDPEFGENGRVQLQPPGNFTNDMSNVVVLPSGQIYIYGIYKRRQLTDSQAAVARLMDDGAMDTGFGNSQDGFTHLKEGIPTSYPGGCAFMNDGGFFISSSDNNKLPLIRFDQNGRYIAHWTIEGGQPLIACPLLQLDDNKLLVTTLDSTQGLLFRRNSDGSVDNSFGVNGKKSILPGTRYLSTKDMARQMGGSSIYLAGDLDRDGFILRITEDGNLDESFADAGVYRISLPGAYTNTCSRVLGLSTGKVLAMIKRPASGSNSCHLIQLTQDGGVDPTFNRGEPVSVTGDISSNMVVQGDGKILVCHQDAAGDSLLTRFLPHGLLDSEFGSGEMGSISFRKDQIQFMKSVAVQSDGKIIVAGLHGSTTVLMRLLA